MVNVKDLLPGTAKPRRGRPPMVRPEPEPKPDTPPTPDSDADFDPLSDTDRLGSEEEVVIQYSAPTAPPVATAVSADMDPRLKAFDALLKQSVSVTMYLTEGALSMPALAVYPSKYSIALILRKDGNSLIFIPKVSSKLEVVIDSPAGPVSYKCMYLGSCVELTAAGVFIMILNRDPDNE
jgi:hypothetical protein